MHPARGSDRPPRLPLPGPVRRVVAEHLDLVDEAVPGLVEGLYLRGSLGFGEWYDGCSDVDFVAVASTRVDERTSVLLEAVHRRVGEAFPRPSYDGTYLTWADLAGSPDDCPDVPCTLQGRWFTGRSDVGWVTWHELAGHGVQVRGPALADVDVRTDTAALRAFSHRNLTDYWTEQVELLHQHDAEAARPEVVEWFVLGIPRLHHAIATGRLTSKDGAGHHAVATWGERWRPVVAEAMTHRALGEASGTWAGREDALSAEVLAFCDLVLEDSLALDPASDIGAEE